MNMKRLVRILLCGVLLLGLLSVTAIAEEGDVAINDTNFPDEIFKNYISDTFDKDNDGILSAAEIANIIKIDVQKKNISSLEGIKYFPALQKLNCFTNQLTELDISSNLALQELNCGVNQLTSLDVSNNAVLTSLDCRWNQLTSLNVSSNAALTILNCAGNPLTSLDVSSNTALTFLNCAQNIDGLTSGLTSLDVSNNTQLTTLDCSSNQLTSLDVSKNTALNRLLCCSNELTSLDVSKNTALVVLSCYSNELTSLDVSKNTTLTWLACYSNELTSLDLSKNESLSILICNNNQLTSLDLSNNTALTTFVGFPQKSYTIIVPATTRTFDLSKLPGQFDVNMASDWVGGMVSGNILTVEEGVSTVTYTYNCGNSVVPIETSSFTLNVTLHEEHDFGDWVVTKEPTGTENGQKKHSCSDCGYSETVEIPANRVIMIEPNDPTVPAEQSDSNSNTEATQNPPTGDTTNLILWTVLLLASGAGMIGIVMHGRRRTSK